MGHDFRSFTEDDYPFSVSKVISVHIRRCKAISGVNLVHSTGGKVDRHMDLSQDFLDKILKG